jgi:hypothetical protein
MNQFNYLIINSRNRDFKSEDSNDFLITFNSTIKIKNGIMLQIAQIGYGEYTVNDYNKDFYIDATKITLTKGNYAINDLLTHINTVIQVSFPNMIATYTESTMKLTFTNDADFDLDFSIYSDFTESHDLLGFKQAIKYSSVSNTITSEKIVNLHGSNACHLYIDKFAGPSYYHSENDNILTSYEIPINVNRGSVIWYYNESNMDNYLPMNLEFNNLRIRLLREGNRRFNINGCDVYLKFVFN